MKRRCLSCPICSVPDSVYVDKLVLTSTAALYTPTNPSHLMKGMRGQRSTGYDAHNSNVQTLLLNQMDAYPLRFKQLYLKNVIIKAVDNEPSLFLHLLDVIFLMTPVPSCCAESSE